MTKFSIVIPLYNKENYIQKTLECVLAQTYREFEVLVVNDGSTDNSLNAAMTIRDERVKFFTKDNEGVSVARNFGIKNAQYDYIAFLDADDVWLPQYLENVNKLTNLHPHAGIFTTNYVINKKAITYEFDIVENAFNAADVLLINDYGKALVKNEIFPLWTGTVCAKKVAIEDAGWFPIGVKRGEDLDMWLRLSLKKTIAILKTPHAIYNQITENNATRTYHSYKESFPYWKWYQYSTSPYVKMYATIKIMELIKIAINNEVFKDAMTLFFKIRGMYGIRHRLLLLSKLICRFFFKGNGNRA